MRVVLADDHAVMRDGLRAILEGAGVEVVGEAATGHEALSEVRRLRPNVVIMDIGMPELNGIDATKRLMAELHGLKVLALSMNADRRYVRAMLDAGASGYLLKNSASDELFIALEAVMRGETYLSPSIPGSAGSIERPIQSEALARLGGQRELSAREREVLQLVAEGRSSKQIAALLGIAVPTVETHRRQIMAKLNLWTIAELTKFAIREGLTSNDP
jgi:DNA-binding NarL/FixJ family response regulator